MNPKLIEFLHGTGRDTIALGANGFHAERHSDDRVTVHYDGRLLCRHYT